MQFCRGRKKENRKYHYGTAVFRMAGAEGFEPSARGFGVCLSVFYLVLDGIIIRLVAL